MTEYNLRHRRIEPIEDKTEKTEQPLELAKASGNANHNFGHETDVDRIPYAVRNPYLPTRNVYMNYQFRDNKKCNSTQAVGWTFRLNSVYDCRKDDDPAYTAVDQSTADTADAATKLDVPTMRDYWSHYYSYWHVLMSNWTVTVIPTLQNVVGEVTVYIYFHGIQFPPIQYDVGGGGGNKYIPHQFRMMHKNCIWKHIKMLPEPLSTAAGAGGIQPNAFNYTAKFQGDWTPGSIQ